MDAVVKPRIYGRALHLHRRILAAAIAPQTGVDFRYYADPMPPVPAPGQFVTVRQRRCVVLEVRRSAVPPDTRRGLAESRPQHLAMAQALEEGGGEADKLAVVWELEAGVLIHEPASLPNPARGFDRATPVTLDLFASAPRTNSSPALPASRSPLAGCAAPSDWGRRAHEALMRRTAASHTSASVFGARRLELARPHRGHPCRPHRSPHPQTCCTRYRLPKV